MKCPVCKRRGEFAGNFCGFCGVAVLHESLCPVCKSRGELLRTIKGSHTNGEPAVSDYGYPRRKHYLRVCKDHGTYLAEPK
jgi:predicted amidophosphoribosyltransferase